MLRDKRLEEWVELYSERLVRLAYTSVHNWSSAEDRVQDAFLKAYQKIDQWREDRDPFPWLAKIVINECRMSYRRSWRELVSDMIPDKIHCSSEDTYFRALDRNDMYQAVLRLPEIYRIPIVLYYFEELSVEKIAEAIGKRTGTVKSRLARGRERLGKGMEAQTYGRVAQRCETFL